VSAHVSFRVFGVPQPQGSKTAFRTNGRTVLVEGRRPAAREAFRSWRDAVQRVAADELANGAAPFDGPIGVVAAFYLPRPKSARKGAVWQASRPDLDKLTRALGDALTASGLIADDARIAHLCVSKYLADDGCPPGVLVSISTLPASRVACEVRS
jgi:Holliday junction resolvase RusA-like endonuclease